MLCCYQHPHLEPPTTSLRLMDTASFSQTCHGHVLFGHPKSHPHSNNAFVRLLYKSLALGSFFSIIKKKTLQFSIMSSNQSTCRPTQQSRLNSDLALLIEYQLSKMGSFELNATKIKARDRTGALLHFQTKNIRYAEKRLAHLEAQSPFGITTDEEVLKLKRGLMGELGRRLERLYDLSLGKALHERDTTRASEGWF